MRTAASAVSLNIEDDLKRELARIEAEGVRITVPLSEVRDPNFVTRQWSQGRRFRCVRRRAQGCN